MTNREAEARAAAEAWAATCTDKYFTDRTRSSWQSIHKDMSDAFMAGHAKGMEEAQKMTEDLYWALLQLESEPRRQDLYALRNRIRAAAGEGK